MRRIRAVIVAALVAGLLGAGAGPAFGDPVIKKRKKKCKTCETIQVEQTVSESPLIGTLP